MRDNYNHDAREIMRMIEAARWRDAWLHAYVASGGTFYDQVAKRWITSKETRNA